MRKKIILLAAALMMFMGVVSASGINGDYKGNPIVNIMTHEGIMEVPGIPAMLYEDDIMIPASILRSLGTEINWNETDQNIIINFPGYNDGLSVKSLMKALGPSGEDHLLNYVQYLVNSDGYIQLDLYPTFKIFGNNKQADLQKLLILSGGVDSHKIRIDDGSGQVTFIDTPDIISYYRGEITSKEFVEKMKFVDMPMQDNIIPKQTVQVQPTGSTSVIETTIDGEFNGWTGETIFKLSNGQIWQQESYDYTYTYDFMPKVLIYKSGSRYKMKVDGVKETIDVKQIK